VNNLRPSLSEYWLPLLGSYVSTIAIGNLVWETAQLPLYTIWRTGTAGENAFAVVHCTIGDVALALGMLAAALLVIGHRDWPARHFWVVAALTVLLGVGFTVFLEWLNVVVWKSWAYSDLMPVLPILGFKVGLSPLLQWILVPSLALWRVGQRSKLKQQGIT
jgi:hypothetical protein